LINVKPLKGRNDIDADHGPIRIGALCTHPQVDSSNALKENLPSLVKLEENVANVRVRQAGTLGGNLCFAEPHADPGTLLIALGATMVAEKASSKRDIAAADFFVDAYETSLVEDEVLTEIRIPAPGPDARSAYLKFGYLERPSVGVAIALNLAGDAVGDIRIAVGCAGPAPRRVEEAEALLEGKSTDEALRQIAAAGAIAGRSSQAISDLHGSQEYKEHIVGVLLKRALQRAIS
jgi:carbon-monoxide dehydrogenase medium subunit